MLGIRWGFFFAGLLIFSYGISIAIKVQHVGLHPWDVLNVALFDQLGLTIGTWSIIISALLIVVSWILDKRYIKLGTFLNGVLIGVFVDMHLWLDVLPQATNGWLDYFIIFLGIIVMGFGGGLYNAAGVGSGPRDGFMLSISDKSGASIGKIRIIVETFVLGIGWILGGPVFIVTFLFTFIQSPIFEHTYHAFRKIIFKLEERLAKKHSEHTA